MSCHDIVSQPLRLPASSLLSKLAWSSIVVSAVGLACEIIGDTQKYRPWPKNYKIKAEIKNENGSFRIRDLDNPTDRYRINSSGTIHEFFGAADFSAGLKAKLAWEPLLYARSKVAIAAAMYDLFTIDAPFFFLDDPEGCEQEAIAVKNMGFTGKACIHPSQVDIINKAFEPTKEEKEEAMKVLKEYEKIGGSGVIKVDGRMVDEPIAEAMRLRLELGEDDD